MSGTPDGDAALGLAAVRDAAWPERTQELMLAGVPLERFGRPGEFGAPACFLASDASSYITGADLPLDSGVVANGAVIP